MKREHHFVCERGPALWKKAKSIIPGGGQLLSKRAERYLPELWPSYYARAKGCEIWDLDGNRYYDFAQMGVGSCILGYADDDVNEAVTSAIQDGSMASLNLDRTHRVCRGTSDPE
jgi:glutamate-1-semialdehyde 2,1-aminomutase